ncbi:MAG: hypothetical protein ACLFTZ_03505 [Acholeplasmataceae bacterium]
MICEACKKPTRTRRSFSDLLSLEMHHICERCYRKYPVDILHQHVPVEAGALDLYTVVRSKHRTHPRAHMSFLKPLYLAFLNSASAAFIYFDEIDADTYQLLDTLRFGRLFVVALYGDINKKKEKSYEI